VGKVIGEPLIINKGYGMTELYMGQFMGNHRRQDVFGISTFHKAQGKENMPSPLRALPRWLLPPLSIKIIL
jgi:hypothetical protein